MELMERIALIISLSCFGLAGLGIIISKKKQGLSRINIAKHV